MKGQTVIVVCLLLLLGESVPSRAIGQESISQSPTSVSPAESPVAQSQPSDKAVEAGKKALGSATDFPWYDAKVDDLKRINIRPEKPVKPANVNGPDWDFSWLSPAFESVGVLLKIVIYLILFTILAVLTYFVIRAFLGRERHADDDKAEEEEEDEGGGVDRVEELPVQLSAPRGDYLSEARRRYEAGDYSGAIIYLFSHQLLQLDRHQRIQLTRGKTNRQYLREVKSEPRLQEMLGRTMVAFEDVFFGHRTLDRERFEACWSEVDEFHRITPQGGPA